MISAGEFRNGVTFEQDGQVLQVVEFQHVKPGKGAAFVRTKTKNVITGSVVVGAFYIHPAVWHPLWLFYKAILTIKIFSHLIASFRSFISVQRHSE